MSISCRIAAGYAAGVTLVAAPVLIFLGAASARADVSPVNTGPSVSHHEAFPGQQNFPQPGTAVHHHHQNNHA
ncbi:MULTISPECIES: hypothetical protein [Mycobacteriaceae]|uniref:Uncharacterized protein n=2 Tax=Mycobacteriaceae TaxID=1762 RepID=A0A1X0B788_9MYCO|nr:MULTISPECIES: hypothetical protein [Mycobacteriaceae]MCV7158829.1 hypothetical protein [Mycolicibacterium brisbanense]ORA38182.1 hypothetical protein BST13_06205 [Mycobacterium aquaticum]GAS88680.1 uncharacterized protein RMCB_2776 [Mycolicibacterium brisbanense]